MSFSQFMKANKIERVNEKYAVTKSLCDAEGKPLEWELKPLTTKENEALKEKCMKKVKGKNNTISYELDMNTYQSKFVCMAVVYPDLNNAELQNSYGVMSAEELLKEMVDNPAEYTDLFVKVQQISGFKPITEDIDEAKNS